MIRTLLGRPIYYGWPMLVGVSIAQIVSWGILYYGFSVFAVPMQADLGWSTVELSGAYSLALLCSGLAGVPVGRWVDRHGPRALMTAGSVAAVLLVLAWSQVRSLPLFYLIMAGVGLVSAAVLYEPAFAIVAVWFRRQRGRAFTVLTFFGALASFVFIPLSVWLQEGMGWRGALVALAAVLAAVTVPVHALLLRRRPEDLGLRPDGAPAGPPAGAPAAEPERSVTARAAVGEARFWLSTFAFAANMFATVTMTVYLIPLLIGAVAGLFGLMSLAGRMLIGPLGDRLPRRAIICGLFLMQIAGLATLALAAPTPAGALLYVTLFGMGAGTLTIMRAALLAEQYGPANYGTISGAQNTLLTGARALAPLSAGLAIAALGGYTLLLWLLALLILLGAAAVLVS